MMECPNCHQMIPEGNFNCPKCHAHIPARWEGTGHASEGVIQDDPIRHQDFVSQEDGQMLYDGYQQSPASNDDDGFEPAEPSTLTEFDRHNS